MVCNETNFSALFDRFMMGCLSGWVLSGTWILVNIDDNGDDKQKRNNGIH